MQHNVISVILVYFVLQTYNYTFQAHDNGETLNCQARLRDFPRHKLTTDQQLNVLCKWPRLFLQWYIDLLSENVLAITDGNLIKSRFSLYL